ncbi:predicted protein [Naegleria gruberi]|uniref:Predicted protein n=1 Tax=Naegleria gruberi TaxID=5762 RepID=D2V762_NAEGR|nr:uncharacterized protein NAEGRDRAFT_57352 [Naegleria gruberi]EFC47316.1 predicted protein [Naegleria gruberi]|eukprot:XP_002680060.1 predicted protein [Naegleria gruberi strain NEG-M]
MHQQTENMKELSIRCYKFDPNNFLGYGKVSLRKCALEEVEILQRINNSFLMQNIGVYHLEGEGDNDDVFSIQVIGISLNDTQEIYLPLYPTEVSSLLGFEFSSSVSCVILYDTDQQSKKTVSWNKVKVLKKIAFNSYDMLIKIVKDKTEMHDLTFVPLPQERILFVKGLDQALSVELSDQISSILHISNCQHRDLQRLAYHLKKNNEISPESYEYYISNLDDKSGIDKLDSSDDINKFIESSKCQEPDFQRILALTSTISWNSISAYFMKRILYEISRDIKNLEIIQRAFSNQYKNLELTDNRDKGLDSQYFDTNSLYILPCYYVPSKNVIQDSSNKKANKISRSEINKEEDVTFEMKTRVMKKTTDMKQIVKQLRLYEARYPSTNELNYYIGISVNEEIYFPRKKEDFIKILKDNISDWKIGNKDGRYGVKACGKRFKLNNKTYTNTERHQMPDIFEYSSMVQRKYFNGMKSFDLVISKDDLAVQKKSVLSSCSKFSSSSVAFTHHHKFASVRLFSTNNVHREQDSEVRGIITPELFTKTRQELRQLFTSELEKIVTKITQEEGYTPNDVYNFALGEQSLRFKVFRTAMVRFGREIPNADLPKILKVKDLVEWFIVKLEKERPPQTYEVPENVKLFVEKHQGAKNRKINEKGAFVESQQ